MTDRYAITATSPTEPVMTLRERLSNALHQIVNRQRRLTDELQEILSHPACQRHRYAIASGCVGTIASLALFLLLYGPPPNTGGSVTDALTAYGQDASAPHSSIWLTLDRAEPKAQSETTPIAPPSQTPPIEGDPERQNPSELSTETEDPVGTDASSSVEASPAVNKGPLTDAATGAADTEGTLLEQIARCLPQGVRPALTSVRLRLSFSAQGQLSDVPSIGLNLEQATPEEIVAANQVIQAALQCGPYTVPKGTMSKFDLVPDFRGRG